MNYNTYPIADLIDEIAMGPFGSNIKVDCFVDKGIPVLNGSNLEGFELSEKSFRYVTEEKADSLKKANAYKGDVVITHRGTLGQIVYIPQTAQRDRYVISQSQFRVKCNKKVLPEYFVYYFHTPIGQHKLLSNASQVGVPALARPSSTFQKIEIEIPDLETQKKVVKLIGSLQTRIKTNAEINDNLQQQAAALFANFYDQAETEVGFTEMIQILGGGTPKTGESSYWNGDIPFFTPKDVGFPYTLTTEKTITEEGLAHCNSRLYPINTVFVTARGTVLASSGMRVGEMVMLNREDIDFNERECVVIGKGNKERLVYFDARTKIHLQNYLNERTDANPALFVSLKAPHDRLMIGGVETRLRELGKRLNLPKVHPHKFRRTLATSAIDKGMPIEQVQQLVGHQKIDTTMHYAMVKQQNVKLAHRKYIG